MNKGNIFSRIFRNTSMCIVRLYNT